VRTIRENIEEILKMPHPKPTEKNKGKMSKWYIAVVIKRQAIMIDKYLENKVKRPDNDVCRAIYKEWGLFTFPMTEKELKNDELD